MASALANSFKCDYPGCTTTVSRQTDIQRHKDDKHTPRKYCVEQGCSYSTGRTDRAVNHLVKDHEYEKEIAVLHYPKPIFDAGEQQKRETSLIRDGTLATSNSQIDGKIFSQDKFGDESIDFKFNSNSLSKNQNLEGLNGISARRGITKPSDTITSVPRQGDPPLSAAFSHDGSGHSLHSPRDMSQDFGNITPILWDPTPSAISPFSLGGNRLSSLSTRQAIQPSGDMTSAQCQGNSTPKATCSHCRTCPFLRPPRETPQSFGNTTPMQLQENATVNPSAIFSRSHAGVIPDLYLPRQQPAESFDDMTSMQWRGNPPPSVVNTYPHGGTASSSTSPSRAGYLQNINRPTQYPSIVSNFRIPVPSIQQSDYGNALASINSEGVPGCGCRRLGGQVVRVCELCRGLNA